MKALLQKDKAGLFRELHGNGRLLVLPNIWDPLGALLLESLGYPAIATASAAIAYANGYPDGEKIPFAELLVLLKKITNRVELPVTADIEGGYASTDTRLAENIRILLETGISGINIEDTDSRTNIMRSAENQSARIRLIRKTADKSGIPLFINARTDICLNEKEYPSQKTRIKELIKRGLAYKEAGADGFYPIGLKKEKEIGELIPQLKMPVNLLVVRGLPDFGTLKKLGVTRISLGPSFLKIAIGAMKEIALKLKNQEGLSLINGNKITSDYLKHLVCTKKD